MSDHQPPDHNPATGAYHTAGQFTGSPYGPPPPIAQFHESPSVARRKQRYQRWTLTFLGIIVIAIFVVAVAVMALNTKPVTHPRHPNADATATALAQGAGYYATVTPQPNATATPTVGPGTPTATPVIVYVPGKPVVVNGTPYPTYTARPGQPTYTPQPTYTTPPAATATPTPHPVQTLQDPTGAQAAQDPSGGWTPGSIENGTQPVAQRTVNSDDALIWNLPNIRSATITAYYCLVPSSDGSVCGDQVPVVQDMQFACSPDGTTWNACAVTGRTQNQAATPGNGVSPYWWAVTWTVSAPASTQYLRALIGGGYPVAFGFGEGDIVYQP